MGMDELDAEYRRRCADKRSDIWKHLPTLYHHALLCEHVTEFGLRSGNSTIALLRAIPQKVVSYDIADLRRTAEEMDALRISFTGFVFVQADTVDPELDIEETDLLFIDTAHNYHQVRRELMYHARKVRKYLIFHDTATFGEVGDDGRKPGIWQAISDWARNAYGWRMAYHSEDCNGLTIFARMD